MSKTNAKGRSSGEPKHVRLYDWFTRCEAWRSLDVYARCLYVEFKARYSGANNGDIAFSGTEMEKALNCSNRPADRALRDLIDRGFVKVSRRGTFDWKSNGENGARSTTYILTEYGIDWPMRSAMPPTKDFMRWTPEENPSSKKTRGDESTALGRRDHRIKSPMRGGNHPSRVTRAPHSVQDEASHAVMRAPTYNIPHPPTDPIPSEEHQFNAWISRNIPDRTQHREAYRLLGERKMTPEILRRMAA